MGKAAVRKVVRTCWHAVVMRFAQRSTVIATRRRVRQDIRKTRKFQAVLTLLPVRDGAEPLRKTFSPQMGHTKGRRNTVTRTPFGARAVSAPGHCLGASAR